jgi:hypothetical protein
MRVLYILPEEEALYFAPFYAAKTTMYGQPRTFGYEPKVRQSLQGKKSPISRFLGILCAKRDKLLAGEHCRCFCIFCPPPQSSHSGW